MDCLEFRRLCGVDPNNGNASCAAHAAECAACSSYALRAKRFDARIHDALRIDVPLAAAAAPARREPEPARRRWMGLAASVVLAAGVGAGLWFASPAPTLALESEVIAHILHEPEALAADRPVLDTAAVEELLARHAFRVGEGIGAVSYVRICDFRGKKVPHLVVEGTAGPVTVMLLTDEQLAGALMLDEDGFFGRIVPVGSGSVAIVGTEQPIDTAAEERILGAVEWEA
jgi:hypothetical protein